MYKSKRIRLRPLEENDATMIMEMRSDIRDVRAYVGRPFPNNTEGEREWIRSLYHNGPLTTIGFAVEEIGSGLFVGFVVAGNISYTNRNATIGVFFHKNARGKGYYKEAQVLFYTYLFNEINLHKLTSSIIPYNEVPIKITAELGYTTDGIRKEQIYQNGRYYDEIMISLLARDFFEKSDPDQLID